MGSHNEYNGYVKLPKKDTYRENLRVDFNAQIEGGEGGAKLNGFSLRMFVLEKSGDKEAPELGVTIRPEAWLDLIEEMKRVYEEAEKARIDLDKLT